MATDCQKLSEFYELMDDTFRRVEVIRDEYGGWALKAKDNLEAGDEFFQVPDNLTIKMGQHGYAATLTAAGCSERGALAAFIVFEKAKGPASSLSPWINMLPDDTIGALGFSTDEIAACGDAELSARYAAEVESCQRDFSAIHAAIKDVPTSFPGIDPKNVPWAEYLWASCIISSRAVTISSVGTVIVPLLDFANHDPAEFQQTIEYTPPKHAGGTTTTSTASSSSSSGGGAANRTSGRGGGGRGGGYWSISASHPVMAGEEVLICYGKKTNLELLDHYW